MKDPFHSLDLEGAGELIKMASDAKVETAFLEIRELKEQMRADPRFDSGKYCPKKSGRPNISGKKIRKIRQEKPEHTSKN